MVDSTTSEGSIWFTLHLIFQTSYLWQQLGGWVAKITTMVTVVIIWKVKDNIKNKF